VRESYEFFCANRGVAAFPAQSFYLIEWVSLRAAGSAEAFQNKISSETITSYCAALRSVHVDRGLATDVFQDETFRRVLAGIRRR
jgi:hypothetical protein